MKTSIKFIALAILLFGSVLAFPGCNEESLNPEESPASLTLRGNGPGGTSGACQANGLRSDSCRNLPKEDLFVTERDILLFMVEEEKMAHDLYAAFYQKWSVPVFDRIRQSEQKHVESVSYLLEKYELDHATLAPGKFSLEALQILYNTLLERGMQSVTAAYTAAALVEETDLNDLQKAIKEQVDNKDITLVFTHLSEASGRHLKSFVTQLNAVGITYQPTVLNITDYNNWLAISTACGPTGRPGGCMTNNGGKNQGKGGNGKGLGRQKG